MLSCTSLLRHSFLHKYRIAQCSVFGFLYWKQEGLTLNIRSTIDLVVAVAGKKPYSV